MKHTGVLLVLVVVVVVSLVALYAASNFGAISSVNSSSTTDTSAASSSSTTSTLSSATSTSSAPIKIAALLRSGIHYGNGSLTIGLSQTILSLNVTNDAQSSTSTIQVTDVCSPDFNLCTGLDSSATTFALPPGDTYGQNFGINCPALPGESSAPTPFIPPCVGTPVAGQSYYFNVRIGLQEGPSVDTHVVATASGQFPMLHGGQAPSDIVSISLVGPSGVEVLGNLTGRMSVLFTESCIGWPTLNQEACPPYTTANLQSQYYGTSCASLPCVIMGAPNPNVYASASETLTTTASPTSLALEVNFSTVTTGLSGGAYCVVRITISDGSSAWGNFAFWMQAQTA